MNTRQKTNLTVQKKKKKRTRKSGTVFDLGEMNKAPIQMNCIV